MDKVHEYVNSTQMDFRWYVVFFVFFLLLGLSPLYHLYDPINSYVACNKSHLPFKYQNYSLLATYVSICESKYVSICLSVHNNFLSSLS